MSADGITSAQHLHQDAISLLSRLTVADVRARLDALEDERRALLPLLRSLSPMAPPLLRRQETSTPAGTGGRRHAH